MPELCEGLVPADVLGLGIYELGNVMVRALNRDAQQSRAVIEVILALCGPPLRLPGATVWPAGTPSR